MKNYVVGILSLFENDLKLFKITAENKYEAVKKGMIVFNDSEEAKQCEIQWQNSDVYPETYEELINAYEDIPFEVIEI
jgi:hypothetical protein